MWYKIIRPLAHMNLGLIATKVMAKVKMKVPMMSWKGSALVFHKTSEPFTVTYTVDAVAKDVAR